MARMLFRGKAKPKVLLFSRADMNKNIPPYSEVSIGNELSSEWDVGLWDQAVWDGVSTRNDYWYRQNVRASGDLLALGCVIVSGGPYALDAEIDIGALQVEVGEASA